MKARINKFSWIIILFLFLGCSKIFQEQIQLENTVWTINTENFLNSNSTLKTKLRFEKNGFVYEEGTIIKYPWRLHQNVKILEINHQELRILQIEGDTIYMENVNTHVKSVMIKVKDVVKE